MIKIIRDGLDTAEKIMRTRPKNLSTSNYKTNYLISVVRAVESMQTLKNVEAAKFVRDPYGIALILAPIGVARDDVVEGAAEIPDVTCMEYYIAVTEGRIDEVWGRLSTPERIFCNLSAQGLIKVDMWDCVKAIGTELGANMPLLEATFRIQPDAEALAFALGSPRAVIEGVTPALGIPLRMAYPSSGVNKIRFPAILEEDLYSNKDYELVHIHRSSNWFSAYGTEGGEVELDGALADKLKSIEHSFVVEGFVDGWGGFRATDLLCWNDVWLHFRPLSERVRMLWRFHEWNMERFVIRSYRELSSFAGSWVLRNLNSVYDPGSVDSHMLISGKIKTGILRVGGRKGGFAGPHLVTKDGRAVFEIDAEIEKEDWGVVVECSSDGSVLRVLGRKIVPDSFMELQDKWGLVGYEEFCNFRLEKVEWPEKEE